LVEDSNFIYNKKLAKDILTGLFLSLFEDAICRGEINSSEINVQYFNDLYNNLKTDVENKKIEWRFGINYTDSLLKEAKKYLSSNNYQLTIVLYATWIEHWINDIIQFAGIQKGLNNKEIISLIKSVNNESKYSWLLPLFDLPRISEPYKKKIKKVIDLRNSFIHYKWTTKTEEEMDKEDKEYEKACIDAVKIIKYLKTYKSKNIFNRKKIEKIVRNNISI